MPPNVCTVSTPSLLQSQPWLGYPRQEFLGILMPAFVVCALVACLPASVRGAQLSPVLWLLVVVGIDVAHVYSTLFRTYFHPSGRQKHSRLLWLIPLASLIVGIVLYQAGALYFWRAIAYLAVFHFVRQQYGFFRLYSRQETHRSRWSKVLDAIAIYGATLYPLCFWHLTPGRRFFWFIHGDFLSASFPRLLGLVTLLWGLVLLAYIVKEIAFSRRNHHINLPKQLILLGTILVWHLGIIVWNSDLAFTLTNVIAHGVPYFTLIWLRNKQDTTLAPRKLSPLLHSLPLLLLLCILFAYGEELLWDTLVWQDHGIFFPVASPGAAPSSLGLIIPLLAVPQLTHYVLDGFIWRRATTPQAPVVQG